MEKITQDFKNKYIEDLKNKYLKRKKLNTQGMTLAEVFPVIEEMFDAGELNDPSGIDALYDCLRECPKFEIYGRYVQRIMDLQRDGLDYSVIKNILAIIDSDFMHRYDAVHDRVENASSRKDTLNIYNELNAPLMGRRNVEAPHHWEDLDCEKYRVKKPVVLCLSGNGTLGKSEANNICKVATGLMGNDTQVDSIQSGLDVVSFTYRPENVTKGSFNVEDRRKIIDNILLPLFINNNEKLDIDTACKNFAMITFFTWCHGQGETNKLMQELGEILKSDYGYSDDELSRIFRATANISFAPIESEKTIIPTIYAISDKDNVINFKEHNTKDIDVQFIAGTNDDPINSNKDSISIRTSIFQNAGNKEGYSEHFISCIKRDDLWEIQKTRINDQDDTMRGIGSNADCVSQMLAYALSVSVANSINNFYSDTYIEPLDMSQMYSELKDIRGAFYKGDDSKTLGA